MAKPSIFSSDYARQMKKRKKKIFFSIIIILAVIFCLMIYSSSNNKVGNLFQKGINKIKSIHLFQKKNDNVKTTNNSPNVIDTNPKNTGTDDKNDDNNSSTVDVNIAEGINAKLVLQEINTVKEIKEIQVESNNITYDISPSKKNAVVYEANKQNIYIVDTEGKIKDITYKQYVSSSGSVFGKEQVLSKDSSYIWCLSPKFIDDDNVVYISQVPWFEEKTTKYLWIVNISTLQYKCAQGNDGQEFGGENVIINNIIDKGLGVTIDDKPFYVTKDGKIQSLSQ